MGSKEQLCNVCGRYISYPLEDMVSMKNFDGKAHLQCAWKTKDEDNNPIDNNKKQKKIIRQRRIKTMFKKKIKFISTPVTEQGLQKYDGYPRVFAIDLSWREPGSNPEHHAKMQQVVREAMPLLARALDRMYEASAKREKCLAERDREVAAEALRNFANSIDLDEIADRWARDDYERHHAAANAASDVQIAAFNAATRFDGKR